MPWIGTGAQEAIMAVILTASIVFTVIIVRRVNAGMTVGDNGVEK